MSPIATTNVLSNKPRSARSVTRAEKMRSKFGRLKSRSRPKLFSCESQWPEPLLSVVSVIKRHARFDQSPRQQRARAVQRIAVTLAHGRRLLCQIERVACPVAREQIERPPLVVAHHADSRRGIEARKLLIDFREQ